MTHFVETEGARIAYDIQGSGPLMVIIPGGNGDSSLFTPLMNALSDRFTVVKIDRRAAGRSTGDPDSEFSLAQAARDVAAVIGTLALGPAITFGTSAGAVIALKLAQDRPEMIRKLLVHEPPVTDILPEPLATKWRQFNERVKMTFDTEGSASAMRMFASTIVGFEDAEMPGDQTHETSDRFFAHEFRHINSFKPDLGRLRDTGMSITMLIGAESGNAYYVQTARYLAENLPCELRIVSGHHIGYVFKTPGFANALEKAALSAVPQTPS
jgi:pimeloyl-ACP methyl ester carboxylesterase